MPTHPHWRFLAEASDLLDGSLDYEDTLANVVRAVLPRLADCAVIALTCSNGSVSREFAAHRDPSRNELLSNVATAWARLANTRPAFARLVRANGTRIIDVADDGMLSTAVADDGLCAMLRELGVRSMLFIPLSARDRGLGCLALATTADSNRHFTARDVAMANAVARRAASRSTTRCCIAPRRKRRTRGNRRSRSSRMT